jgi:hypothetical protein
MKPREHQGYRHIQEIYAMVPEIQCKGPVGDRRRGSRCDVTALRWSAQPAGWL